MVKDLGRVRQESEFTLEELSDYTDISIPLLRKWERTGDVPRGERRTIEWGLWAIRRDRVLEESGLPECEWLEENVDEDSVPDWQVLEQHFETCDVCAMRDAYIDEHVGPQPAGLLGRALEWVFDFPDWLQAATMGIAMVLVAKAGFGIAALLGLGLVRMDVHFALGALLLLVVAVVGGGAGGVVYHLTRRFRERGTVGHYISSILAVYGYLGALMAMGAVAIAVAGREAVGEDIYEMVAEPVGWIIWLVLGAFFGIALGRGLRSAD